MTKAAPFSSLQAGDLLIVLGNGREPLRVRAQTNRVGRARRRSELSDRMRKLLRAMVASKAPGRKK